MWYISFDQQLYFLSIRVVFIAVYGTHVVHSFRHVAVLNTDTRYVSIAVCDKDAVQHLRSAAALPTDMCCFYCSVWYKLGTSLPTHSCISYRRSCFFPYNIGLDLD